MSSVNGIAWTPTAENSVVNILFDCHFTLRSMITEHVKDKVMSVSYILIYHLKSGHLCHDGHHEEDPSAPYYVLHNFF